MLYKLLNRFINLKTYKYLGRWKVNETEKQKEIKIIWANYDNCGDKICKDPKKIKEILSNNINE